MTKVETHEQLAERAKRNKRELCESMHQSCPLCPVASQNNGLDLFCWNLIEQHPQLALELMTDN